MAEVKEYTREELENMSREEFINVVTESVKVANEAKAALDKVRADKDYWYKNWSEADEENKRLKAELELKEKQRLSAIRAISCTLGSFNEE